MLPAQWPYPGPPKLVWIFLSHIVQHEQFLIYKKSSFFQFYLYLSMTFIGLEIIVLESLFTVCAGQESPDPFPVQA